MGKFKGVGEIQAMRSYGGMAVWVMCLHLGKVGMGKKWQSFIFQYASSAIYINSLFIPLLFLSLQQLQLAELERVNVDEER